MKPTLNSSVAGCWRYHRKLVLLAELEHVQLVLLAELEHVQLVLVDGPRKVVLAAGRKPAGLWPDVSAPSYDGTEPFWCKLAQGLATDRRQSVVLVRAAQSRASCAYSRPLPNLQVRL